MYNIFGFNGYSFVKKENVKLLEYIKMIKYI